MLPLLRYRCLQLLTYIPYIPWSRLVWWFVSLIPGTVKSFLHRMSCTGTYLGQDWFRWWFATPISLFFSPYVKLIRFCLTRLLYLVCPALEATPFWPHFFLNLGRKLGVPLTTPPPPHASVQGYVELLVYVQGYNELLYAHLLDSDGARLTYTHFTAKVRSTWFIVTGTNELSPVKWITLLSSVGDIFTSVLKIFKQI